MLRRARLRLAVAALAVPLTAAAASSPDWKQAAPGFDWEFPRDHRAHDGYRTEWWYFVGFAETADRTRRFAWQFTAFRSGIALAPPPAAPSPWGARHAVMGHAVVADLDSGERVFSQTSHRESPGFARFGRMPAPEIAWFRGPPGVARPWSILWQDGAFFLSAADERQGLSLQLAASPTLAPLLHGDGGYSRKSEEGRASLYYSHTRLQVQGSLQLGGGRFEVRGTAWMDREFGSAWLASEQTGWDWFGLNLDDGSDLMLYLLRRADGTLSYASGTLRREDGVRVEVRPSVEVLDSWTPPDPGFVRGGGRPYPAAWRIRIPAERLDFRVLPLLADQENRRPPGYPGPDIPYWEGAVRVEEAGDRAPAGQGFAEMTGYRAKVAIAALRPDTIGVPNAAAEALGEGLGAAGEGRELTMMDGLVFLFRWLHVFVGILWIGHLYFFNFVNAQMAAQLDGRTKQKVVPQLMPRALYWFRWGAAWTWITGAVLLLLVFYHGGLMFGPGDGWGGGALLMVAVTFLAVFLYDALWRSGLRSKVRAATLVSFALLAVTVWLFVAVGGFTERAVLIHTGAMFGTMMAFNVWFRIWPAQQRIIAAVKAGEAPAAADPALAGLRSKHNTYLSLPLLWAMLNEHATPFFGGNFGIPGEYYWIAWLVIVAIGWHVIFQCYRIAGRVSGM